jgi:hypothetical protein
MPAREPTSTIRWYSCGNTCLNVIAKTGRLAVGVFIQEVYPGAKTSTGSRRHRVTTIDATDPEETEDPK